MTNRFPLRLASTLLFASALFLGARDPAGRSLLIMGTGLFGIIAWWQSRNRPYDADTRGVLLAMTPLPLLCLAQLIGVAFFAWSPTAVSAQAEFTALVIAYEIFLISILRCAPQRADTQVLVVALVALGIAQASYGVLNLLTGNEYLLVYRRWTDATAATGTLVSKNHFAYLLEMSIPFGAAMLVAMWGRARANVAHEKDDRARAALFGGAVAMMALGLLLSRSRMGLTSLAVASSVIAILGYLVHPPQRGASTDTNNRGPLVILALAVFGLLIGIGIDTAFERFSRVSVDLERGRLPIWLETWTMITERPLLGHGFGSYPALISGYREGPTGLVFAHAHSDYLEAAAEGGLAGISIIGFWLALFARRLFRALASTIDPEKRRLMMAAAVAILSIALHSTVDFGLRIPAVALALLVVVAIFVRTTQPVSSASAASNGAQT
jgi:O-antigen ligase